MGIGKCSKCGGNAAACAFCTGTALLELRQRIIELEKKIQNLQGFLMNVMLAEKNRREKKQ